MKTYCWVKSGLSTAVPSVCRLHDGLWAEHYPSTRNYLCFAPSMNSTMDFSKKPLEDGVVDSPLKKKVKVSIIYSASSLLATEVRVLVATMSLCVVVRCCKGKYTRMLNKIR